MLLQSRHTSFLHKVKLRSRDSVSILKFLQKRLCFQLFYEFTKVTSILTYCKWLIHLYLTYYRTHRLIV